MTPPGTSKRWSAVPMMNRGRGCACLIWALRAGAREERLLRRYHEALAAQGVRGYSWEMLLADYRLALAYMLSYPVWDASNGSRKSYWWPKLQCLTSAFQDWRVL